MTRNNLRTGWRAWLLGEGGVVVPYERVKEGHLLLEHEGALLDLGPCSLEDLRMVAFVAQEAYVRLPSKRGRSKSTPGTLSRVRNLTHAMWQATLDPDNRRRRRVFGVRVCDCGSVGDGFGAQRLDQRDGAEGQREGDG